MRKLFAIAILCLLPIGVSAQSVATCPIAGAGVNFNNAGGNGVFGAFLGANVPMYTDTASGFTMFDRTQYFYAGHDNEFRIQAVATWLMFQKQIKDWRFAIGNGVNLNIDGEDIYMFGIAAEVGYNILGALDLGVGINHMIPENRRANTFAYVSLNLMP